MANMRRQKLESYLEDVDDFDDPKISLEQYMTRPHLAATVVHTIESRFQDIGGKMVADLGCGSGMLTIGTVMMNASFVVAVDVDEDALTICRQNLSEFEISNVDLIRMDVLEQLAPGDGHHWKGLFDVVIMNPPFGTKGNEGIDVQFLKFALLISSGAVYSMHKSSTREHMKKLANSWGVEIELVAELRFDLPQKYKRHRHESVDIEVDMLRFAHVPPSQKPRIHNIPAPICTEMKNGKRFGDKRKHLRSNKK